MYVDEGSIDFYGVRMSFMIADTEEELHAAAEQLGLTRHIFARERTRYYDVAFDVVLPLVAEGAVLLLERKALLERVRYQHLKI